MRNVDRWIESLFEPWSQGCTCGLCTLYGLARERVEGRRDRRADGLLRALAAYPDIVHQEVVQLRLPLLRRPEGDSPYVPDARD